MFELFEELPDFVLVLIPLCASLLYMGYYFFIKESKNNRPTKEDSEEDKIFKRFWKHVVWIWVIFSFPLIYKLCVERRLMALILTIAFALLHVYAYKSYSDDKE